MDELLERYQKALDRIPKEELLLLPPAVQEVLRNSTDLEVKAKMFEEIAERLESKEVHQK